MRIHQLSILFILLLLLVGCSISQKPIDYGEAACHYCSMTIVDKQHAAQIVTDKGKVFNYDAIECMMNQMNEADAPTVALFLANDYSNPGELMDATNATYLISEGIPSPMGAFLTGFSSEAEASAAHASHGGELYDWEGLKEKFKE
ncbi:nitrous oxide reductase accessory protein NosL [Cryomorphaceae bacterium 1068]|nr:nitrous oxide reductase accessory protein NosL [Cryomorphaceae bacterium 1068]